MGSGARDGAVLIYDIRFNRSTDPSNNESSIRSVNNIQHAHFIDNPPSNLNSRSSRFSNVLKPRSSILNSSPISNSPHSPSNNSTHSSIKKPSPVACVSFQNEHTIVSAGATDGLIKVWDLRKIYSSKKIIDQSPLYVFENQSNVSKQTQTPSLSSKPTKGYSSILFNHSKTKLYANCLNNEIYEYNFLTYNPGHTRGLKSSTKPAYHVNKTNFIKSSLSICENFLLTGSSDFNAYIYPTSININCEKFKKFMPVIVLKGHTNEVTTVDWNPIDSNQLVTCSDDNTIRVWNVKRDIDKLQSTEVNFCRAELTKIDNDQEYLNNLEKNDHLKYMSTIRNVKQVYTKHIPNMTGVFDDTIFTGYEYKNFLRNNSFNQSNEVTDLEKELCLKCENINIEDSQKYSSSSSNSPTSLIIKSIDKVDYKNKFSDFKIIKFETPTSNLPINWIPESEMMNSQESMGNELSSQEYSFEKKLSPIREFANLLSQNSNIKSKTKILKKKTNLKPDKSCDIDQGSQVTNKSPPVMKIKTKNTDSSNVTPLRSILKITVSTSKKRSATDSLEQVKEDQDGNEMKPNTKRRLILQDSPESTSIPTTSTSTPTASRRTILHYFSQMSAKK